MKTVYHDLPAEIAEEYLSDDNVSKGAGMSTLRCHWWDHKLL